MKVHLALGIVWLLTTVLIRSMRKKTTGIRRKEIGGNIATVLIGFGVLPLIFFGYFVKADAISNIFHIFFELTLFGHTASPDVPFGITFNVIVQGLPLFVSSIYGVVALALTNRKTKHVILYEWVLFALILALFPPHFGHRYIYLIAPVSVFAGIGLDFVLLEITKRIQHFKLNYGLIVTIVLSTVIITSVIPSTYFQSKQYPQYNINSESLNLHWLYADADSYETQIKLGEFLKKNTTENDPIFIHAWGAEIYYLANKMPPSIYVWTVPGMGVNIPEDEIARLVETIRQIKFKYIVMFDDNLETLRNRSWDPIVKQTLLKYFFVGSIGNAQIFGKFDSFNEYQYFNFIENLPLAAKTYHTDNIEGNLQDLNNSIFIPVPVKMKILEDERDTIFQHPITGGNSSLSYRLFIPKNSTLQFGIALDPEVWDKTPSGDGVEFVVRIKTIENERTIFSQYIDPRNLTDRRWHDFRLDLEEFADQDVALSFITSPGAEGNAGFDWAHWSNPIVLTINEGTNST